MSLLEPTRSTRDVLVVRDYGELSTHAAQVIAKTVAQRPDTRTLKEAGAIGKVYAARGHGHKSLACILSCLPGYSLSMALIG